MNGICITIPEGLVGQSSFELCMQPVLWDLAEFWWPSLPLYGCIEDDDAEFEEIWSSHDETRCVPPGLMLPRFAKYMESDWCDFGGSKSDLGDAQEAHKFLTYCQKRSDKLKRFSTELSTKCVDNH